jgi:hypothetical protein
VKPPSDTFDLLPTSPIDCSDWSYERRIVPALGSGTDFPAASRVSRDFWGSDVPPAVSAAGAFEFASEPLSNRGTSGVLSTSMRVFGYLSMALAVLIVVLDYLLDDQRSSVLSAALVGAVFTLGLFLAAPRK